MMNEETEPFEQRLSRQPLRQVPATWRGEILAAADLNQRKVRAFTSAATFRVRMRDIFWPAPAAWAGLAAVWIFIFAVNLSMRDPSPRRAEKSAPASPEVMVELRKQQMMLAELIGPREPRDADRPKNVAPRPRGARAELVAV